MNTRADKVSRIPDDFSDKMLHGSLFRLVEETFGTMHIDLFATERNAQRMSYVSLRAEPGAAYSDTFSRPLPRDL